MRVACAGPGPRRCSDMQFERYWIFAICCAVVVAMLLRLLLRERVSLQHSLAFLLFMLGALVTAIFPSLTYRLGRLMGFALPSNFFFAILIGVLVMLHLGTVIALSRLEARTIALTQELGLVQEQVARLSGVQPHRGGEAAGRVLRHAAEPGSGAGAGLASPVAGGDAGAARGGGGAAGDRAARRAGSVEHCRQRHSFLRLRLLRPVPRPGGGGAA